ncbi:MAG TPA: carboxypeptidase regulatory-like domain-containing protein, partial [Candidatus Limnocylindria bacterium]
MPRPVMRRSAHPVSRLLAFASVFMLLTGQVAAAPQGARPAADPSDGQRPAEPTAPIEQDLLKKLETGETERFVVEFSAEADLSGAADIDSFRGRGQFVVDRLKASARAQRDAIKLVRATSGARAESYWLRNTLIVTGGDRLAEQLASLPGVERVRAERVYPLIKPVETEIALLAEGLEPEWGVEKIGAPAVWETGVLGSGIVVANIDTGVDFEHPALVNQYRGNLAAGFDHNYNWWDPTGICGDTPCDNAEHGTHTMGTMVGGDGPGPFTPDIGVAPGAQWIAAKGCEDFGCSEGALLSSGQFVLAPTDLNGENEDPGRRPDIVNNSWGGAPGDPFYLGVVTAWRAAGIVPVFSAGNSGPFCDSGGSPGDYLESFSVGATDIDDVIAEFSSRGPSSFGKGMPDVSAPGVDVISSVPGGGYASFSGTSMAAPHTAGTLALVMSAEIGLVGQVDAATLALRDTAFDIIDEQCGGDADGDPNNVYGDGRIDAAAAVALVATGGTLAGTVTDSDSGDPIAGADVSASNGTRTFHVTTASDGTFELFLAAGSYAVTAEGFGYAMGLAEAVVIETDATTVQDFALVALPRFEVTGQVTAASDEAPIEDASVLAVGTPVPAAITNPNGVYSLTLPEGSYTLRASAGGCTDFDLEEIDLHEDISVDFQVARKLDNFGHGCAPIAFDWVDATTQTALYGDEFVGRLVLPFEFPFYGESYSELFLSDNGYLNFLGPDQFNSFPVEIPSESPPNAAIYPLWQEMRIDGAGAIEYATIGDAPDSAFVIEYAGVSAGSDEVTFEVKLWENGDIDLLYADAGDGMHAGIGIENAAGDDALQFSYLTDVLAANTAFRITEVPTGLVRGTVTDANDGLPVAGALVEAVGSGRSTTTDAEGTYQLRLLPGSYTLNIGADGYTSFDQAFSLAVDEELTIDAALAAPIGSVDPLEVSAQVELGETTEATVTISNTGSGPLAWTVRERPTGATPPELPEISGAPTWAPTWG